METVTVRDIRLNFPKIALQKKPMIITRRGKPCFGIIPFSSDIEVEDFIIGNSPHINKLLKEADKDIAAGKIISVEDYLKGKRV